MRLLWALGFAVALAVATQGCSIPISPDVHVDQPVVQVDCLELVVIVNGTVTEKTTSCDAGISVGRDTGPTSAYKSDAGSD